MAVFRKKHSSLFVGLFALGALFSCAFLLIMISTKGPDLDESYFLTVRFDDASGVVADSAVRMGGALIGKVEDDPVLRSDYRGVDVKLQIRGDVRIPAEARFLVKRAGFLGDAYVLIEPGDTSLHSGEFVVGGSRIEGSKAGFSLDNLGGEAEGLMQDSRQTAGELRRRLEEMEQTVENVNQSTHALLRILERIEQNYLSQENAEKWNQILAATASATLHIEEATKPLPSLVTQAEGTLGRLDDTVEQFYHAGEQAGVLVERAQPAVVELERSLAKAGRAADSLAATLELIQNGDGVTADLLRDAEFSQNIRDLIFNLKESGLLFYDGDRAVELREEEERRRAEMQRRWQEELRQRDES